MKQPVVIANRPGAGGAVGNSLVANAKPDGYTLLMALSSISVIPEADKLFDRKPAYTLDQVIPIALITADPTILVVHPSLPAKSVKELIALAKSKPGQMSYSTSGVYVGTCGNDSCRFAPRRDFEPCQSGTLAAHRHVGRETA